ncbi:hypothetical protein THAOC_30594, partial [Thalassiosira oceanica]
TDSTARRPRPVRAPTARPRPRRSTPTTSRATSSARPAARSSTTTSATRPPSGSSTVPSSRSCGVRVPGGGRGGATPSWTSRGSWVAYSRRGWGGVPRDERGQALGHRRRERRRAPSGEGEAGTEEGAQPDRAPRRPGAEGEGTRRSSWRGGRGRRR